MGVEPAAVCNAIGDVEDEEEDSGGDAVTENMKLQNYLNYQNIVLIFGINKTLIHCFIFRSMYKNVSRPDS